MKVNDLQDAKIQIKKIQLDLNNQLKEKDYQLHQMEQKMTRMKQKLKEVSGPSMSADIAFELNSLI